MNLIFIIVFQIFNTNNKTLIILKLIIQQILNKNKKMFFKQISVIKKIVYQIITNYYLLKN